jgi:hypothetical protein
METKKSKLQILPPKKKNDKIEFEHLHPHLLRPSFSTILLAPTASGKSTQLLNYLESPFFYKDVFESVYFISPTIKYDKTLSAIYANDEYIKIEDDDQMENLDVILEDIIESQKDKEEEERKHILIIIDDAIQYLKKSKVLSYLLTKNRHWKISVILSVQSWRAIPPRARANCSAVVVSHLYNKKEYQSLYDEIGSNFKDFEHYYNLATSGNKYDMLYIDNRNMKLYHNYDKLLWEK